MILTIDLQKIKVYIVIGGHEHFDDDEIFSVHLTEKGAKEKIKELEISADELEEGETKMIYKIEEGELFE